MLDSANRSVSLGLALVRLVTGALLFLNAWSLITGPGGVPNLLAGADLSSPVFSWWGENLLEEHPVLFSHVIVWAELLGGAALFLGALVRPVGAFVFVVLGCCAFSDTGLLRAAEILAAGNALACAIGAAGCTLGLDAIFVQHFPRWITWLRRRD